MIANVILSGKLLSAEETRPLEQETQGSETGKRFVINTNCFSKRRKTQ